MKTQQEVASIQQKLQDQGVKYALASFVDIHGMCKAKAVPPDLHDRNAFDCCRSDWQGK